eukprot:3733898-Amphidinium_carterae.3
MFDLSVWSDVGSKKNILYGHEMWRVMKGAPWTPMYWKVRHAAALDMQAQCGMPVAFLTWAPLEWSAPYHDPPQTDVRHPFQPTSISRARSIASGPHPQRTLQGVDGWRCNEARRFVGQVVFSNFWWH